MALRSSLTSIISWLRAGYSAESPERGYLPLLALMARKLTDADIAAIANELASASHPATAHAIREAIGAVTHDRPPERFRGYRCSAQPCRKLVQGAGDDVVVGPESLAL
jgi:hypothetical protein